MLQTSSQTYEPSCKVYSQSYEHTLGELSVVKAVNKSALGHFAFTKQGGIGGPSAGLSPLVYWLSWLLWSGWSNLFCMKQDMVLPLSGSISFSQIQSELGGNRPINASSYYNSSGKQGFCIAGLPSTGALQLSAFRGRSNWRKYPPTGLTAQSCTISGQAYGNGSYAVAASSNWNGQFIGYGAFDGNVSADGSMWHTDAANTYTAGSYNGNKYIVSDYKGEWLKIQLPEAIVLTWYNLYPRPNYVRNPKTWKVYGSNDDKSWTELDYRQGITSNWAGSTANRFNLATNTQAFMMYAIVVSEVTNNEASCQICEWQLFGCPPALTVNYGYTLTSFTYAYEDPNPPDPAGWTGNSSARRISQFSPGYQAATATYEYVYYCDQTRNCQLCIQCDNEANVYINGALVYSWSTFSSTGTFYHMMQFGFNRITIVNANWEAGWYGSVLLSVQNNSTGALLLKTGANWRCTPS